MRKTSGNVIYGYLGGRLLHIFPRLYSIMERWRGGGWCWCLLIPFRIWALYDKKSLETGVDCYIELRVKCDRAPRSDSEMHR